MSKRSSSIILFLILIQYQAHSQRFNQGSLKFVEHLESIGAYDESQLYLQEYVKQYGHSDTTNLYLGRARYFNKEYAESISYLLKVTNTNTTFWNQSQFLAGWQSARMGDYIQANQSFSGVSADPSLEDMKYQQLSGVALLTGDLEQYEYLRREHLTDIGFEYKKHQEALDFVYDRMKIRKRKSPFLAGMMSAIVPGTGKLYLGEVGQGTMALVTSAIMGFQAYEGYRKDGVNSARFIVFGSLFSVFYVANIWGSVVAVKVANLKFNQENHETVLLHMHIPIRLYYN